MQIYQVTLFLAACTLSVLVLAQAQDEADTAFLYRLRDLAARAAAEESPALFDIDGYKRGVSMTWSHLYFPFPFHVYRMCFDLSGLEIMCFLICRASKWCVF